MVTTLDTCGDLYTLIFLYLQAFVFCPTVLIPTKISVTCIEAVNVKNVQRGPCSTTIMKLCITQILDPVMAPVGPK